MDDLLIPAARSPETGSAAFLRDLYDVIRSLDIDVVSVVVFIHMGPKNIEPFHFCIVDIQVVVYCT